VRQLRSDECPLCFVEMPPVQVGTQHKADWISTSTVTSYDCASSQLASTVPIAAIQDFILVQPYRLVQATLFDILHKRLEAGALLFQHWKDVSDGVEFQLGEFRRLR